MGKVYQTCEKCTNQVIIPFKICNDCNQAILNGDLPKDYAYCDDCKRPFHKNWFLEGRWKGNTINRCNFCANRNYLEYE